MYDDAWLKVTFTQIIINAMHRGLHCFMKRSPICVKNKWYEMVTVSSALIPKNEFHP